MKKILLFLILASLIVGVSCKKKNDDEEKPYVYSDNISGTKIRYSVAVVAAENSISKSTTDTTNNISIRNASVSIVVNDSVHTKKVDEKGMVHFSNLFSGNTIVKVECEGYTTANLIVDLTKRDTTDVFDSGNMRAVSTIISLFPTEDGSAANVSGNLYADTDLTNSGLEMVYSELMIRATINPISILNHITHSASGGILDLSFENSSITTISENGSYSINVPTSLNGLEIFINTDNFATDQRIVGTDFARKIFKADTETIIAYPGASVVRDIVFY